jgi:hypothetical protein
MASCSYHFHKLVDEILGCFAYRVEGGRFDQIDRSAREVVHSVSFSGGLSLPKDLLLGCFLLKLKRKKLKNPSFRGTPTSSGENVSKRGTPT